MYPHSLPPETRVMRRRVHNLACVWPVVPEVCLPGVAFEETLASASPDLLRAMIKGSRSG
jgi:hypothetical protein